MLDAFDHGVGVGKGGGVATPCGQGGVPGAGAGRGVAAASAASREAGEGHMTMSVDQRPQSPRDPSRSVSIIIDTPTSDESPVDGTGSSS